MAVQPPTEHRRRLLEVTGTKPGNEQRALAARHGCAAHEQRTVAGSYTIVVGWLSEPPLVDEPNAITVRVADTRTNTPVKGLVLCYI